ncbi:MAG: hypothetical protein K0R54_2225 [Clostridiaceae bacterium]|jgi:hypothetical protein|nr:hypothetical protein [Clostridiaceae bacterium]
MSNQVQFRRGTTVDHSTFTGAEGEITVDTTKKTLVVHDGVTAGGAPLAKEAAVLPAGGSVGQVLKKNSTDNYDASWGDAGSSAVENWITPTFQNNWVNYDAVSFGTAGYFKDLSGVVHLRGMVKSGTLNTAIFTLPIGYRPAYVEINPTVANGSLGRVDVLPNGAVYLVTGSNAAVTLAGISFRAA